MTNSRWAEAVIAAAIFTCVLVPALGQSSEEQIKQLERDRQQAFIRGDIARIEQETADDYVTINGSGAISDKPRMMTSLASGRTKVLSVSLEDLKARVYGDVAVLTGIYRDVNVTQGAEKHVNARFTRVFVRQRGKWLAVSYQQTLLSD
jgi:ketosteroid isomerase-like protein